jgi:hypothetical protein
MYNMNVTNGAESYLKTASREEDGSGGGAILMCKKIPGFLGE